MALITCPECGENISDKADECIHCGLPLDYLQKDQISCPECGKLISDDAYKCVNCGFPIGKGAYSEVIITKEIIKENRYSDKKSNSSSKYTYTLIIFCGIALLVILGIVFISKNILSKSDGIKIVNSIEISDGLYLGKRASDGLSNIYTQKIDKGTFHTDTIRLYQLNTWRKIDYEKKSFEEYLRIKFPEYEIEIGSSDFKAINDSFIQSLKERKVKEIEDEKNGNWAIDIITKEELVQEYDLKNVLVGVWGKISITLTAKREGTFSYHLLFDNYLNLNQGGAVSANGRYQVTNNDSGRFATINFIGTTSDGRNFDLTATLTTEDKLKYIFANKNNSYSNSERVDADNFTLPFTNIYR